MTVTLSAGDTSTTLRRGGSRSASTKPTKVRAAIYCRISEDTTGRALGVERQAEDCRELAELRGWEVVAEYPENDVSAFSGVRRPLYEALMGSVRAGEIDRIVVYMTSRLWRSRAERSTAMAELAKHRVSVTAVRGPELDLATATGRMVAGILGEFDTAESEIKSERVARASDQRAQQGRPSGGLGYGWDRVVSLDEAGRQVVSWVVDEAEAAIVREIVDRVIGGEPIRAITRDLTARGVAAPGATHNRAYRRAANLDGTTWGETSVRKIARRESNAALRVHRGEIVGRGTWPALISEEAHEKVAAILDDPDRRRNYTDSTRRHLLTCGVGECGVCGGELRVTRKGGNPLYVCDGRGCVGRREERVDDLLRERIVEKCRTPDAAGLLDETDVRSTAGELTRLQAKLDEATAMYLSDKITAGQMSMISERLRADIAELEQIARTAARPLPPEIRRIVTSRDPAKVWDGLTLAERRALIEALGLRVRILPTRQGPGFDPASVEISFTS